MDATHLPPLEQSSEINPALVTLVIKFYLYSIEEGRRGHATNIYRIAYKCFVVWPNSVQKQIFADKIFVVKHEACKAMPTKSPMHTVLGCRQ